MIDNMPKAVVELIAAQRNFDSEAYSTCFSQTATVFDEGKNYTGRREIKEWIAKANQEYKIVMEPLEYSEPDRTLKAKITGHFPGSPIVLTYQYEFINGLIHSLKIV